MGGLMALAHIASEAHSFVLFLFPSTIKIYVENWVHVSMPKGAHLNLPWFLFLAGNDFLICCLFFIGAIQSWTYNYKSYLEWRPYNQRLYIIWSIYFAYHFFDSIMLYVNYKQSTYLYWVSLATAIAGTIGVMWPVKIKKPTSLLT